MVNSPILSFVLVGTVAQLTSLALIVKKEVSRATLLVLRQVREDKAPTLSGKGQTSLQAAKEQVSLQTSSAQ